MFGDLKHLQMICSLINQLVTELNMNTSQECVEMNFFTTNWSSACLYAELQNWFLDSSQIEITEIRTSDLTV